MRLIRIKADACKGCGICVAFCPVKVLEMSGGLNVRGVHFPVTVENGVSKCTKCRICMIHCPDFAIVVDQE
ncbi:MAG: 4Fe-4S binding protein [Synergistaceae bacterium]|jgi:2-oxoglutarate ferredoxin oxidoreductase subunit delta|nr:4Fe-4S binding protein [Synergistaceae bacterium]